MRTGLALSESHPQNGMTAGDMQACIDVANQLNEVIIFRSTGPWAKRWIKEGYPTKNFHVKGKSSDWGPQAGLVPFDGIYSKVGHDAAAAAKGTRANQDGIASGFASAAPLVMSASLIEKQLTEVAENRTALDSRVILQNGHSILTATRPKDGRRFTFFARKRPDDLFQIEVFEGTGVSANPHFIRDRDPDGKKAKPFLVMGSSEVGADNMAMTGDYDLLAVCPRISDRFSQSAAAISKPGIHLQGTGNTSTLLEGLRYGAGAGMDNVLDGRLHTGSDHGKSHQKYNAQKGVYGDGHGSSGLRFDEHADMGNLTPRILRCINALNARMGAVGDAAYKRRVHHNAESHRYASFGALKRSELDQGEGFPFTVFQPRSLVRGSCAKYDTVCTLESMQEFLAYAADLDAAGYWLPTNFTWGMRNTKMDSLISKMDIAYGKIRNR
jgi:hypothetical protein